MSKSESQQVFPVGQECVLNLSTTSGDVRVSRGEEGQVVAASPDGNVAMRQEGNSLHLAAPSAGAGDVSVQVPQHCDLVVRSVSGDIELQNLAGQVSVQTMSGDIAVEHLRGDLRVHTVSGDLAVRAAHLAALDVDSVSGDSLIESQLDSEGVYHLRSVSGDLRLLLPAAQRCTVHQNSLSGEFTCRLPHEVKRQGWGRLEAAINGGGVVFHVQSTSGDVLIEASEEPLAAEPSGEPAKPAEAAQPTAPAQPASVAQPAAPAQEAPAKATKPLPPNEPAAESFGLDQPAEPSASTRRMEILKAIEQGKITVSEGLARLRELE